MRKEIDAQELLNKIAGLIIDLELKWETTLSEQETEFDCNLCEKMKKEKFIQQIYERNDKIIPIHILIDSTFDYNTYCCIKEQLVAEFLSGEKNNKNCMGITKTQRFWQRMKR